VSVAIGAYVAWLQTDSRFARYPLTTSAQFEEGIRLAGIDLPGLRYCSDDTIPLRLYWFTDRTPATDYKTFLHVVTPDDASRVAQVDTMPFDGFNPMTRWEPGELVDYAQEIPLEGVAPGAYTLLLGLYDQVTMQNLRVLDSAFVLPGDRVRLADLEIIDCGS